MKSSITDSSSFKLRGLDNFDCIYIAYYVLLSCKYITLY